MAKQPHGWGRSGNWIGYLSFFSLAILLTLGGYVYWTREKLLSPETFSRQAFIADQVIQKQLHEIGILEKDIFLERSIPKKQGKIAWTESLLKVRIPRSSTFSGVEDRFRRSLSSAGKPFSVDSSKDDKCLRLEVKVMDRVTHRLTFLHPESRAKMAIVIDDLGKESHIFQEILHWDVPLTFSILPLMPHSRNIASEAHKKGKEVILHLPMEPEGYPKVKPGEGALLEEMNEEQLLRQLSKDIETVPYVTGVNNHMGSRLMENPEKTRIIFSELKKRGLFFLDSRTTPQTVGLQTAKSLGLKASERSLFLDNSRNEGDVRRQVEKLIHLSLVKGKAIGIGHPRPSTIRSLKKMIPKIQEKGIDIVPLSELLE